MKERRHPPFVDFRAVKARVTMEQTLARYGLVETMKRSGDSLSGACPIHKGTNPTQFRVSLTKNCWNCFGDCGAGGNVLDNTLILGTSEHANANAHNYSDHPFVLVGKACGNIRAGMHHRHPGGTGNQDAPDVMLTAVRAAGVPLDQLGQTDAGFERWTRDTVSEIET